jgi:hypothetical protein
MPQILRRLGLTVGARLPAKNISRDIAQTDTPRSPATRLLQIRVGRRFPYSADSWGGLGLLQERACPRKISAVTPPSLTHRVRQQAGSYSFA